MDLTEKSLAERLRGKCVFFATPCYGAQVFLPYHVSMMETLALMKDLRVSFIHAPMAGDSLVQRIRNVIVGSFLQSDATHLMWIDADIGWKSSDVIKLLAGEKDICGAVYPKKCYPISWPANLFIQGRDLEFDEETKWILAKDMPTGFMMIARNVIEAMIARHPEWKTVFNPEHREEPFSYSLFDCYTDEDGTYLSEDFAFCRRAQADGFKVWCDPSIVLTHTGYHMFGGTCMADNLFPQPEEMIQGWMDPSELRWLKTAAGRVESACEIGCWKGRSSHALLSKCPGPVYCVDHWQGSLEDLEGAHAEAKDGKVFDEFMKNVGHFTNLHVCKGDSAEVADQVPKVDMVFIDGSHEYEAVKRDIETYLPKAKVLICGDDYGHPGVHRAVTEIFNGRASIAVGNIWQVWL